MRASNRFMFTSGSVRHAVCAGFAAAIIKDFRGIFLAPLECSATGAACGSRAQSSYGVPRSGLGLQLVIFAGVLAWAVPKQAAKWLWLLNPHSSAMRAIGSCVVASSLRASSSRVANT